MKAGLMLTLVFAVSVGAFAQNVQRERPLMQEEVPVTIVQSLQKDFSISDRGRWKVFFKENQYNSTTTIQYYTFIGKSDGKRVEIQYNPDGTVERAKGVVVPEALARKK